MSLKLSDGLKSHLAKETTEQIIELADLLEEAKGLETKMPVDLVEKAEAFINQVAEIDAQPVNKKGQPNNTKTSQIVALIKQSLDGDLKKFLEEFKDEVREAREEVPKKDEKNIEYYLGNENADKLTVLRELNEKIVKLFSEPGKMSDQQMISLARKSGRLNQLLLSINKIKENSTSNEEKASSIKAELEKFNVSDISEFLTSLESEIKAVKTVIDEKSKAIATEVKDETQRIAGSADERIAEDVKDARQQKQELFEARAKLMEQIKEVDERYNKALVQYDQKRSFFASFREARNKVDEKTGKKKGIFASIKAALTTTKDSKIEAVDRQRKTELDQIADERTRIENEIAACDAKIVALSEQRKMVKQEVLKEYSMVADALKSHMEASKNYKGKYNEHQVTLNEREAKYMELLAQERLDGRSEGLTTQIEAIEAEIMQLRNEMFGAQVGATFEERKGQPTVENILGAADDKIAKLKAKAEKAESYSEKMKIEKQIYTLEEQQRDIMDPIVADEHDELYGKSGEEKVEKQEEEKKEEKKVPGYKELNARYSSDREGMLYVVNLKIDELKEKMQKASLEERKEIMAELDKLYEKQKEYEKPLTRRDAYRKAKEHYDMDR